MYKKNDKKAVKPVLCAVAACIMAMPPVHAAELEEIIVTATKREQSLQDIGVSVIAFSGEDLDKLNVQTSSQLAELTPNLSISSDRPNQSFPAIRGVGTPVRAPGVDQGVAIYLDGAQIDSAGANLFSVLDLEQAEVLKGPQGTLYGRNAVGGVINLTSRKPGQETKGNIKVGFGDDGFAEFGASLEGGLSDTIAGRLSVVYKENDDYFDNVAPGVEGLGSVENTNVRGQVVFTPNDRFEATVSVDYFDNESDAAAFQSISASSGLLGPVSNGQSVAGILGGIVVPTFTENDGDIFSLSQNFESFATAEIYGGSIKLKYDLNENIDLVSISSFRDSEQQFAEDLDASPNQYLEVVSENLFEAFTQEFQLQYSSDTLSGVVGLFYVDSDFDNIFSFDPFREFNILGGSQPGTTSRQSSTESIALFTQWDWNLSEKLTLTAGIRYSDSEKSLAANEVVFTDVPFAAQLAGLNQCFVNQAGLTPAEQPACLTAFVPANSTSASGEADFDRVSPKIGLSYQVNDDLLIHGSITEGYRDGGISGSVANFALFDEEILTAYEVGFKSEFADGSIRLNASAFYYDYEDLQLELSTISAGGMINTNVINAADASIQGAEVELLWAASDNFKIAANLGLLDTEYEDVIASANVDTGFLANGNEFPNAPEVQFSIIPEFTFEALGGNVNWRTEINYTDEQFEDFENGGFANAADAGTLTGVGVVNNGFMFSPSVLVTPGTLIDSEIIESRTLVNTSLTYSRDNYQISFWVRNLFDEEYQEQRRYVAGVVQTQARYGLPRTLGINAKLNF